MNYQGILSDIYNESVKKKERGKVADYIPDLAQIDLNKFGMALVDEKGTLYTCGDAKEQFSVQSISKVLTLSLAFRLVGDDLLQRVGVEPSGDPFNHLSLLEQEQGSQEIRLSMQEPL